MSQVLNHIAKARAALIVDQPFFASILLPMPISESVDIPTMATDGESIIFNPNWVLGLSLNELTFVLAHEVLHAILDHMGRRDSRDHNLWNQAADYVINDLLIKEKVGVMPDGGLHDPSLVQKAQGTAEGVYKLLPQANSKKGTGAKGGALDSLYDLGSNMGTQKVDAATKQGKQADIKVKVIQARNAAKMQGRLSAGLDRLISEAIEVKTDWKSILRRFISEKIKSEYSFARPKRRFLADDLNLPSLTGERLGSIDIAVDCSGSIDINMLNLFSAEINAIKDDTSPKSIRVIYFDSEVLHVETFTDDEQVVLKPKGGGGTAFSPVFKYINDSDETPVVCIFLTDLYCDDFGSMPSFPVLWCHHNKEKCNFKVPFGETLHIESEN